MGRNIIQVAILSCLVFVQVFHDSGGISIVSKPVNPTKVLQGTLNYTLSWNWSVPVGQTALHSASLYHKTNNIGVLQKGTPNIGVVYSAFRSRFIIDASNFNPVTLIVKNVQPQDAGEYSMSLADTSGSNTKEASTFILDVLVVPVIITGLPPVKEVKTENQTGNYTCTSDGKPAPKVIWFVNDANVTDDTPYLGKVTEISDLSPNQPKLIRVTSTLAVVYTWRHYGDISCVAKNVAGFARETTALEIRHCPVVKTAADHPKNVTLDDGQSGTFTCTTIGNPPTLYNEWYFNGVLIPNSRGNSYTRTNVGLLDAGVYSCRGVSTLCPQGGPLFGAHLLIKNPVKFTQWPTNTTVSSLGQTVELRCHVVGKPAPKITWIKIGDSQFRATGAVYRFTDFKRASTGVYRCTADNGLTPNITAAAIIQYNGLCQENCPSTDVGIQMTGLTWDLNFTSSNLYDAATWVLKKRIEYETHLAYIRQNVKLDYVEVTGFREGSVVAVVSLRQASGNVVNKEPFEQAIRSGTFAGQTVNTALVSPTPDGCKQNASICLNGGLCVNKTNTSYQCFCVRGFTGEHCQTNIDDCAHNGDQCKNRAKCLDRIADYKCVCTPGWTGKNCDVDIDECEFGYCKNGATCHNGRDGYYNCTCVPRYTDRNCSTRDVDKCVSQPCENGATCSDLNYYYYLLSYGAFYFTYISLLSH